MNKKFINNILGCCAIVCALSACTDVWEAHYQANKPISGQENSSDKTLWDLIESDQELTEFKDLLVMTGYDSLLRMNRSYTVWAPVNGSGFIVIADDVNPEKPNKELNKKRIVENHIANFIHPASGVLNKEDRKNYKMVEMLNTKMYDFEGSPKSPYTFAGKELCASNIVAKNGMLHKLDGYVGFAANIWEQLGDEPQVSKLWKFLEKDYKREFNPSASVQGPVVDGQVTWLDSAFTESCRWFREIGWLDREDSSYTMYALTDNAWDEMYEMTKKYFNYPSDMQTLPAKGNLTAEEATDSMVMNLMCQNLVFSNSVNKSFYEGKCDTLRSNYLYGYQIFENEEAHALSNGTIGGYPKELSNGKLYVVDKVNYEPFTCWHDTLRVEGESLSVSAADDENNFDYSESTLSRHFIALDDDSLNLYYNLSGHSVGVFEATTGKQVNPKFKFNIRNVLSANYPISIVLLPPQLINPSDTAFLRPNKFDARLANHADSTVLLGTFISDSLKLRRGEIDTIVLAENYYIPVCEYDYNNLTGNPSNTYLSIESAIEFGTKRDPKENNGNDRDTTNWKYDNHFRIDQVIFEPVKAE